MKKENKVMVTVKVCSVLIMISVCVLGFMWQLGEYGWGG